MTDLTAFEAEMLERIPPYDSHAISSSEVAHRLHEFAALHRLERKKVIEIEYGYQGEEAWITRVKP